MSRTRVSTQAYCLAFIALCFAWTGSSRAEAPAPQDSLWNQQWNMKNDGQSGGTLASTSAFLEHGTSLWQHLVHL